MAELALRAVRKTFGGTTEVLRGIDLDIADGEFMVFVGPSGCGKSTLLRMIAGLEDITAGELRIGGERVEDVAGGGAVEAGNDAQQRGFAAAGGADEDHELALGDLEVDVVEHAERRVLFDDVPERQVGHRAFFLRVNANARGVGLQTGVRPMSPSSPSLSAPRGGEGQVPRRLMM